MAENVKVAVRVRPFSSQEKKRNAKLVVHMKGKSTTITHPSEKKDKRIYKFDYSYWSHDGFVELENGYLEKDEPSSKYCDQNRVFEDLGQDILTNAWKGYNSTLFAYGQTGSGKSYSIVGYGANKGIVPVISDRLFAQMTEKANGVSGQFEVTFSMLEIYSEKVRDLLNPSTIKTGGDLKVREHPKRGFYVERLETVPVGSFADISERMAEGTKNRTIAATNMNKTSSRAHTIVGITFLQKTTNAAGEEIAKTSTMNLVDLAGSERVRSSGATGDRLKEGAAINQSLSTLGNVISALAEQSVGKKAKVPFRDSVLTKLLKNALGGNSKTVMIAAISPADTNYEETISTLRFADRAKQIKTIAKVNEDPTAKLIRDLKEENEKMKKALLGKDPAMIDDANEGLTAAERELLKRGFEEQMKAAMEENERKMKDMEQTWQEKLDQAHKQHNSSTRKQLEAKMQTTPHLYNLNADPQMCKILVYILEKEEYVVGKPAKGVEIPLLGAGIQDEHASIRVEKRGVFLKMLAPDANVRFNGDLLFESDEIQLRQNDRVLFGTTNSSHLYVFHDPQQYKSDPQKYPEVSYEMAQDEITANVELSDAAEISRVERAINEGLAELQPAVDEVSAISKELDQKVKFDIFVVPPLHRGVDTGFTEIMVQMRNPANGMAWVWTREEFLNKKFLMQDMYQRNDNGQTIPLENNPFVGDPNADRLIASGLVSPSCMANKIDCKHQVRLVGYEGENMGILNVSLVPYDSEGQEIDEFENPMFIDDPKELIGQKYEVKVKIESARGLPGQFKDVYVTYDMYIETDKKTKVVNGTVNLDFNYVETHLFKAVTSELITWMKTGNLIFRVRGKQQPLAGTRRMMSAKQSTRTKRFEEEASFIQTQQRSMYETVDINKLAKNVLERRCGVLEQKLCDLNRMVEEAERNGIKTLTVKFLKDLLTTPKPNEMDRMIAELADGKHGNEITSRLCRLM